MLLKPGTGLKDAPQAFSLKLRGVTRECGLKAILLDSELLVLHQGGRLCFIMSVHVDDLKFAGEPAVVKRIMAKIEQVFGKLRIIEKSFTNCGIRHSQHEDGSISLDQNQYLDTLKPIIHDDLRGQPAEKPVTDALKSLYMSLLGAIAYTTLTRMDIAIYVAGLQRATHVATMLHVRKLNILVRWAQRNPQGLVYRKLKPPLEVLGISDSSFKREQEDGLAMRGLVILIAERQADGSIPKLGKVQVLDYYSRKQRHVARSTFAAELLAATDAFDCLWASLLLTEVYKGAMTAIEAQSHKENGSLEIQTKLVIDAMSVFSAVTAQHIKVPSEKGLMLQLLWLREQLDSKALNALVWTDTRNMLADGLTKGNLDRADLRRAMAGEYQSQHEIKTFSSKSQLAIKAE